MTGPSSPQEQTDFVKETYEKLGGSIQIAQYNHIQNIFSQNYYQSDSNNSQMDVIPSQSQVKIQPSSTMNKNNIRIVQSQLSEILSEPILLECFIKNII